MAFCSSLRRRRSFASVISDVAELGRLKERNLVTHDLEISLPQKDSTPEHDPGGHRLLRCLLFSASCTADDKLLQSIKRIQHFTTLTEGEDLLVVFSLVTPRSMNEIHTSSDVKGRIPHEEPAICAYSRLKAEMLKHNGLSSIPMLLLSSLNKLPSLLQMYVASLAAPTQHDEVSNDNTLLKLLRQCIVDPPMTEMYASFITNVFHDLQELAAACSATDESSLRDLDTTEPSSRSLLSDEISPYFSSSQSHAPALSQHGPGSTISKLRRAFAYDSEQTRKMVRFWQSDGTLT